MLSFNLMFPKSPYDPAHVGALHHFNEIHAPLEMIRIWWFCRDSVLLLRSEHHPWGISWNAHRCDSRGFLSTLKQTVCNVQLCEAALDGVTQHRKRKRLIKWPVAGMCVPFGRASFAYFFFFTMLHENTLRINIKYFSIQAFLNNRKLWSELLTHHFIHWIWQHPGSDFTRAFQFLSFIIILVII